jgi:cell division protease FtsH
VFGDVTTGAENDLQQITAIARQMVTRWGMSPEVGLLALDGTAPDDFLGVELGRPRWYSEQTARRVDAAVRDIVDAAYTSAVGILTRNRAHLDALAAALLERESLDGDEVRQLIARTDIPVPGAAPRETVPA